MAKEQKPDQPEKSCPQCGADMRSEDRFCMQCGLQLDDQGQAVETSPTPQAGAESAPRPHRATSSVVVAAEDRGKRRGEGRIDFHEIVNYPFSEGEMAFFRNAIPFSLMVTLGVVLCLVSRRDRLWPYFLAILPFSVAGGFALSTLQHNVRESISSLFIQRHSSLRQNIFVVAIPVTVGMIILLLVIQFQSMLFGTVLGNPISLIMAILIFGVFVYGSLVMLAHYAAQGAGLGGLDYGAVREVTRANWFGFLAVLVFWLFGLILLVVLGPVFVCVGIYCLFRYRDRPRKLEGSSFLIDLMRRLVLAVYDRLAGTRTPGRRAGVLRALFAFVAVILVILLLSWIAYLYWLTTVSARLLAHMYRGEKIEFRRSELEL
jgi:hypothetical protein